MASVNKVIIVGNLGKDPDVRSFPDGGQVANVSIATTDKWKDKQSGEMKEATEWHRVNFSGRLAEIAGQYLRKGSQVYIEGSLRTRKWTDKDGTEKFSTEIRGDSLQMLGSKTGGAGNGGNSGNSGNGGNGGYDQGSSNSDGGGYAAASGRSAPRSSPPPRAASPAPAQRATAPSQASGFDEMDDDIPF